MFGRTPLFLGILATAVALPYAVSRGKWGRDEADRPARAGAPVGGVPGQAESPWTAPVAALPRPEAGAAPAPDLPGYALTLPRLTGPPVGSLADLVRWDIRPEWVIENWARVSTLPGPQMQRGLRGAVMTGTAVEDLCGTVTYFFNPEKVLDRVVITGMTGSTEPTLAWARMQLQFVPDPASGMGVYVRRVEERLEGVLVMEPARIVRSSLPRRRYQVFLELARPGSGVALSDEAMARLKSGDSADDNRSAGGGPRPEA